MTFWNQYSMEAKIRDILVSQRYYKQGHHFGKPLLSGYQIAIEFGKRYPAEFKQFGHPIGGRGTQQYYSLASYITGQLSKRIKSGQIRDIEGGFLSNLHLEDIVFDNNGNQIHSSLTDSVYDMSIFRAKTDLTSQADEKTEL